VKSLEFYWSGSANINGQANDVTVRRHADIQWRSYNLWRQGESSQWPPLTEIINFF
jgi:hypothetical protein